MRALKRKSGSIRLSGCGCTIDGRRRPAYFLGGSGTPTNSRRLPTRFGRKWQTSMTPPGVDMGSVDRVLIIKLSAFGDIIHALPVAAALKGTFPHIEITWAVQEAFAPLIADNPTIDHIITLPNGEV